MAKKKNKMGLKEYGYELLEVSKLVKADWNYKDDDEKRLDDLVNNIKRNGQIENLIVRKLGSKYEIVNGNHRYDALVKLKQTHAIVCNKGDITKEEAIRIAIETNETKFPNDNLKLAELLNVMLDEYTMEDLTGTLPYSQKEIENFQNLLDFDWGIEEDESGMFANESFDKKITISVTQDMLDRWNELKNRFDGIIGYENDSKVFEFAVIEALNIPLESLK